MPVADETWADAARFTRSALGLLGRDIGPRCLPGEPDACGGTFAQHAAAHMATIKAICDHQIGHLGPQFAAMAAEIYEHEYAELAKGPH